MVTPLRKTIMKTFIDPLFAALVAAFCSPLAIAAPHGGVKRDGHRNGEMTYYDVGLGACGHDDSGKGDSENIIAVSPSMMDAGANCGRKVLIHGDNGNTVEGVIRDKCLSCTDGHLDVSQKIFKEVAGDLGVGKTRISWNFA